MTSTKARPVAVIGAGAAGLVAARELDRAGFNVTIFEQSNKTGGIWNYTDATDDDPLGQNGRTVFASLYRSLRTNLPRDLMAFMDYTFDSSGGGDDNWARYPHHRQVLEYLERFANDFDLTRLVRFETEVTSVEPAASNQCLVETNGKHRETYDAVAVCNGHYSKPRIPPVDNIETFTGGVSHSHNYRKPEPFTGKRVALWGTAASGADIAIEIADVADAVFWCGHAFADHTGRSLDNGVELHDSPQRFFDKGIVTADGARFDINAFIFCTGYTYEFPFLADGIVSVDDNWVNPLYRDLIPPQYPTIAFIGLPYLIVPFPVFEMQAKWFVSVLNDSLELPAAGEMLADIKARAQALRDKGVKQRHFHKLGDLQSGYYNRLADEIGQPHMPGWFTNLARDAQQSRMADPLNFRELRLPANGPTRVAPSAASVD